MGVNMVTKRIYGTARNYETGLSPTITIFNPGGVEVISSSTMTELGSEGIYYYDYTPTVNGNHIGIITLGARNEYEIIEVGCNSTQRIYYYSAFRETGLTDVKITIYDPNSSLCVSSVTMTELEQGIYYYDFVPESYGNYICKMSSATNGRTMTYKLIYQQPVSYDTETLIVSDYDNDDYLVIQDAE